ncbi:MAG: DNA cytosine methyltransferase [Nitrosomonadales bacterium]|nr:DNA cytosine methyltransferase [Nitrosomonadales bacterium]
MLIANTKTDSVLSLFSGAGGFSYGFANAGLLPICGAEINKDACATYEENIGSTCHNVDLSAVEPNFFRELLGAKEPFAVIGGPPCQGFSTAGARDAQDPRNRLIFNYLRIVGEIRPRWFIFENVEGLLTSGYGADVFALVREFLALGYSVRVHKANLAAYGVPQTRKRVLIIGNRLGVDFSLPDETYSYDSGKSKKPSSKPFAPTLDQALAGLGGAARSRSATVHYLTVEAANSFDKLMRAKNTIGSVTEHFHSTVTKEEELYSLLKPGQTMKDLPEEYQHDSFRRRAFRRVMDGTPSEKRGGAPSGIKRLYGDLQSLTITGAAPREFIHPHENRPLTIRECARIQTFPDHYRFYGNATSVTQQIGNAVPPLAATAIARHLQAIDGAFGSGIQPPSCRSEPRLLGFVLTESTGMSEALQKTERMLNSLLQQELDLA